MVALGVQQDQCDAKTRLFPLHPKASALLSHLWWSDQNVPGGQPQAVFRQRVEEGNVVLFGPEAMTQAERGLWEPSRQMATLILFSWAEEGKLEAWTR